MRGWSAEATAELVHRARALSARGVWSAASGTWWAAWLVALVALTPDGLAHPKPGAHADVRFAIEADGVHADVIMNLRFVDQLVRWDHASRDEIFAEEEPGLAQGLAEYFGRSIPDGSRSQVFDRGNAVRIDGEAVPGQLLLVEVIRPEPETRPGFVQNPALLLPQVRVKVHYPTPAAVSAAAPAAGSESAKPARTAGRDAVGPREVSLVWGSYPLDFQAQERDLPPVTEVEAVVTHRSELHLVTFSKREPEFIWRLPPEAPVKSADDIAGARGVGENAGVPVVLIGLMSVWLVGGVFVVIRSPRRAWWVVGMGVLTASAAVLTWPVARVSMSRVFGGRPPLDRVQASEVFMALHAGVYRAFEFTRESDIYDTLAQSVDGPLLDRVYSDVFHALVMQDEGGAMSRVRSLNMLNLKVLSEQEAGALSGGGKGASRGDQQFRVRAEWMVEGVVYHWGHSHSRVNRYTAEYAVARRPAGWRIVGVRPLEQVRVSSFSTDGAKASAPSSQSERSP